MPNGRTGSVRGLWGVIALGLTFVGLLRAPASVAESPRPEEPPNSNKVQVLDRLLPAVRRAHPGDLSDAHGPIYGPSGDPHYHLKWVTPDGDIYWFDADARSGQVQRTSPGRDSFDDR